MEPDLQTELLPQTANLIGLIKWIRPYPRVHVRLNSNTLLICFSHLRWDFVYQRPQHLMTRAAHDFDVIYFEEPVFEKTPAPFLRRKTITSSLTVITPVLQQARNLIRQI